MAVENRTAPINVRVKLSEKEMLEKKAEALGLKPSELYRMALLKSLEANSKFDLMGIY